MSSEHPVSGKKTSADVARHQASDQGVPGSEKKRQGKKKAAQREIQSERRLAKNIMVASMGALVLSGYYLGHGRNRTARNAHLIAGIALMGAAYWHHTLYTPPAVRLATIKAGEDQA